MEPIAALGVAAVLLVATTCLGWAWRARQGRARASTRHETFRADGVELGTTATLVQFSSAVCAPCRATARVLGEFAQQRADVVHVEIDVSENPELVARWRILQTPTTLVVDERGVVTSRIGGAITSGGLASALDRLPAPALTH